MGIFNRKPNAENETTYREDREDSVSEDVETYTYEWTCDNCDESCDYDIPIRTRVIDFIKNKKCEYCGCSAYDLESRKINVSDEEE